MSTTIELVTYQTKPEANPDEINAFQHKINDFCLTQPGFLYRSVSQHDNVWHDIVYWQDKMSAENASKAYEQSELMAELGKVLDHESLKLVHMQALTEAMPANN